MLAPPRDPRFADWDDEIGIIRHCKALSVDELVLEKNDRIGIADRSLQQTLMVGAGIGSDDFEAGYMRVPARITLNVVQRRARRCRSARGRRWDSSSGRRTCSGSLLPS